MNELDRFWFVSLWFPTLQQLLNTQSTVWNVNKSSFFLLWTYMQSAEHLSLSRCIESIHHCSSSRPQGEDAGGISSNWVRESSA